MYNAIQSTSDPHLQHAEHAEPRVATLQQWRNQALNIILYVTFGLSIITFPPSIWSVLMLGQTNLALFYGVILAIIGVAAFVHKLPFKLRAAVFLALPFLLAVVELLSFGYSRDAGLLLFTCIILSALLVGARWSGVLLAASLLLLAGIAWLSATARLNFVRDPGLSFVSPIALISSWTIFMMLSLVVIAALISLINRLSQSLQMAEQSAHVARQARVQAEAQAGMLAQQSATLIDTEQQLRDLVATLETPTILLANGVLLAPIVGVIDSRRAQALTERLLTDAQYQQADTVILDLAGVALVDTQVAQALMQTTQALRLLGCGVVITGISAEIATTLTRLDFDLRGIRMARSPQEVLERL
jgi:anti-anti-sigma regulatory factor